MDGVDKGNNFRGTKISKLCNIETICIFFDSADTLLPIQLC